MKQYLQATDIIDWQSTEITQLAHLLKATNQKLTAQLCFEWVRDQIRHSFDYKLNPVTCRASEVLKHRTGYCFAKSHLLAALLRANSIPAGFCYQRLSVFDNGAPYSLHGFNAVFLEDYGWYRIDCRGNKLGVDAQFTPPQEKLAFSLQFPGEADCSKVFTKPLPIVIKTLKLYCTWQQVLHHLPDLEPEILRTIEG